jgi:hypothetical protein
MARRTTPLHCRSGLGCRRRCKPCKPQLWPSSVQPARHVFLLLTSSPRPSFAARRERGQREPQRRGHLPPRWHLPAAPPPDHHQRKGGAARRRRATHHYPDPYIAGRLLQGQLDSESRRWAGGGGWGAARARGAASAGGPGEACAQHASAVAVNGRLPQLDAYNVSPHACHFGLTRPVRCCCLPNMTRCRCLPSSLAFSLSPGKIVSQWSAGGAFITFEGKRQRSNNERTLLARIRSTKVVPRYSRTIPVRHWPNGLIALPGFPTRAPALRLWQESPKLLQPDARLP